ncbi:FG-GAP repeat domain-containing protein [Catellatospora tritici]|uniref:FG-GAP repeat domain-containing protein n=1 Tax=Catellatospora tritici TaxID=2851566 RepID=UPI001C2D1DF6|nr:VCBS repeat-containing protein [Catellatospora tritici]MBV1854857.1 VCBS repeat-containing protein [Catellatospora tritici]
MRRKLAILLTPVLIAPILAAVGLASPAYAACTSIPATADPSVLVVVYRVGKANNVNDKVLLSGFETGWVESHMNNLPCGDKSSLGVFQQRWDYGWGTPEQIMDPVYSATQYYVRAIVCDRDHPGYTTGQVAQCVQRSGFPDRYDQVQGTASGLLATARRAAEIHANSPTDFNGDGKDDIVTFNQGTLADVYVSPSTGTGFAGTSVKWNDFFSVGGETPLTGDFNGDGKDDIVTFTHGSGTAGDVYVGLSTGTGFLGGAKWNDWFAPGAEIPAVGDVNGDGKDDIITFTHDARGDVYVSLSTGTGFAPGVKWHEFYAPAGEYPAVADANGDGKADLITFTQGAATAADVYVALSNGSSFGAGVKWHDLFAVGNELPRVGDVNGDGKADIVTFTCSADADVYAAVSNGSAFVGTTVKWNDFFCVAGEFPYLADVNGDGKDDAVVFTKGGTNDVYVGLSTGTGFVGGAKWHDFFGLNGETTL